MITIFSVLIHANMLSKFGGMLNHFFRVFILHYWNMVGCWTLSSGFILSEFSVSKHVFAIGIVVISINCLSTQQYSVCQSKDVYMSPIFYVIFYVIKCMTPWGNMQHLHHGYRSPVFDYHVISWDANIQCHAAGLNDMCIAAGCSSGE